jgi:hypothetical protein
MAILLKWLNYSSRAFDVVIFGAQDIAHEWRLRAANRAGVFFQVHIVGAAAMAVSAGTIWVGWKIGGVVP